MEAIPAPQDRHGRDAASTGPVWKESRFHGSACGSDVEFGVEVGPFHTDPVRIPVEELKALRIRKSRPYFAFRTSR